MLAWLGCLTGLLGAILLLLVTGRRIKIELVLPTLQIAMPGTLCVEMKQSKFKTVVKPVPGIPAAMSERYLRLWSKAGWQKVWEKYGGDDTIDYILMRQEPEV